MSSRHLINPAVHDPSKEHLHAHPGEQLKLALCSLLQSYPPKKTYGADECHGLYSGPTSIACLFLHLGRTHPQLWFSGQGPSASAAMAYGPGPPAIALAYLAGKRPPALVTASRNGVINEELALCAVHAALTADLDTVKSLARSIKDSVLTEDRGSDEWLYGRAGCLYLLRLVRSCVGCDDIVKPIIEDLIQRILSHGPSWPWHGKDYLGKWSLQSFVFYVASAHSKAETVPRLTARPSRRCSRAHRHHHPDNPL